MPGTIIEARNINFSYMDGTQAINNLSLKIPKGKKIALLGNNGAGKTTLFLHFNGVHRPQEGKIFYHGIEINYKKKQLKELRKNVGIVFQDPDNQLFSASVYQDISFGPINIGWEEGEIRKKIEEVMKRTGTWDIRDKPTHALSHGQKKRVAIAGVLAMEPEVIFLDEPTAGLDPFFAANIMTLLDQFNQEGKTVVIASHNIEEVYAWADYIFIMHKGEIISEGISEEVFRLGDALEKANLIKPWVLEIYDSLLKKGKIADDAPIPKTREEIIKVIKAKL